MLWKIKTKSSRSYRIKCQEAIHTCLYSECGRTFRYHMSISWFKSAFLSVLLTSKSSLLPDPGEKSTSLFVEQKRNFVSDSGKVLYFTSSLKWKAMNWNKFWTVFASLLTALFVLRTRCAFSVFWTCYVLLIYLLIFFNVGIKCFIRFSEFIVSFISVYSVVLYQWII